ALRSPGCIPSLHALPTRRSSDLVYSYKDKYLFSASYRADGSSYFAPGNKWGSFPSVSIGWVASQEKFMEKVDWISNLKLRGSYRSEERRVGKECRSRCSQSDEKE